ncbi:MAG: zinc ribbon domain-containing protein [Candidatus Bathyarchaeia archaeon]|nr:zinc ribbon domain-containing protein [Candidatus Bathyarchaeota archaeon]
MATCNKCGFRLPEGAVFCPNCGAPVRKAEEYAVPSDSVASLLRLGMLGTFLSIAILTIAGPVELYFVPSFVSALIIIYLSKTKRLRDAIIIAATIYLFTDAIITGMFLGTLYAYNQSLVSYYQQYYGDYVPTFIDVLMYSISPVTAVIAGYIGSRIAPRKREGAYPYYKEGGLGPTVVFSLTGAFKKFKYALIGSYTS